jgi:hypothetical protein
MSSTISSTVEQIRFTYQNHFPMLATAHIPYRRGLDLDHLNNGPDCQISALHLVELRTYHVLKAEGNVNL